MGRPLMNFVANIRDNIQERRAERQGYGNCHSTQSHFEGCRTQVEGCQPNNFRAKIAGGVPAQSVPAQSMGGARATVCENGVCRPADMAASATASSATTTTPSAATKNYPDTKGQYGVKLGEGVYARIEGGKILATIDVSSAPSNGKFDYSFKEGTRSSRGSFDLDIVRAGSGGVVFDKTAANKLNARAESTVDEIKLKIPDGKGGSREISISKESILKAEAAAEKQAADAKKQAEAKAAEEARKAAETKKAAEEAAKKAAEEAKKRDDTPVETSNQGAASTTSTTTDKQGLAADAAVVKRMLETNLGSLGWNSPVHNDIANPDMYAGLDLLLARHSNQTARAQLIDTIDPAVLGELVHELPEADKESVMAKLLAPLGDGKINTLTSAVDTLAAEYGKSGNPFKSAFDTAKINEAFGGIASLGEGAESFAKLVWYKKGNDDAAFYSNDYDKMKKALGDAVAPQSEPDKDKEAQPVETKVDKAAAASSPNPTVQRAIDSLTIQEPERVHAYSSRSLKDFQGAVVALKQLRDAGELPQLANNPALEAVFKAAPQYQRESLIKAALKPESLEALEVVGTQSGQWWVDKKDELLAIQAKYNADPIFKAEMDFGWDLKYRFLRGRSFEQQLSYSTGNTPQSTEAN